MIGDVVARIDVPGRAIRSTARGLHQLHRGSDHIHHRVILARDIVARQIVATTVGGVRGHRGGVGHIGGDEAGGGAGTRSARGQRAADGTDGEVVAGVAGRAVIIGHHDVREIGLARVGVGVFEGDLLRAFDIFHLTIGRIARGLHQLNASQGIAEVRIVVIHDGIAQIDEPGLGAVVGITRQIASIDVIFQCAAGIEVTVIDLNPIGVAVGRDDEIVPTMLCAAGVAVVARGHGRDQGVVRARLEHTVQVILIEVDHDPVDAGGAPLRAFVLDAIHIAVMPDEVAQGGGALRGVGVGGIGVADGHLCEQDQRQHAHHKGYCAKRKSVGEASFHGLKTPVRDWELGWKMS